MKYVFKSYTFMKKELKHCFKTILKYQDAKIDCALETTKSGLSCRQNFPDVKISTFIHRIDTAMC